LELFIWTLGKIEIASKFHGRIFPNFGRRFLRIFSIIPDLNLSRHFRRRPKIGFELGLDFIIFEKKIFGEIFLKFYGCSKIEEENRVGDYFPKFILFLDAPTEEFFY
jgi:hypothetical protein